MLRTRRVTRESQKWHDPYSATELVGSRERKRGRGRAPRGGIAWALRLACAPWTLWAKRVRPRLEA
jgi:hypothetical protein